MHTVNRPTRGLLVHNVAWSLCLLVTSMSCAKTAEPIKIPWEVWTQGAMKPLGGDPDPGRRGAIIAAASPGPL